jgi:hypothetical protein
MTPKLPDPWQSVKRASAHRTLDLIACPVGTHRSSRGFGIWQRDGALLAWIPRAQTVAWFEGVARALVVFERGHRSEPPLPSTQVVARISAPTWALGAEILIPVAGSGCAIEEVAIAPSGRWATTQRFSGQGEHGFDILDLERMQRIGGLSDRRGYILETPIFANNEARVIACTTSMLSGFWCHRDDDIDMRARGGVIELAQIHEHDLTTHRMRSCVLEIEVPPSWLPDDPWSSIWYGPTAIEALDAGVRMVLPGGDRFEHREALPDRLRLPPLSAFAK